MSRNSKALNVLRGPALSPGCFECPLARGGKPPKAVPGEGPRKPKFIVIGEGPGQQEKMRGRPFIGRSGQLLMDVLASVGIEREDVYLTNATLCEPGGKKSKLDVAAQCCRPRLDQELKQLPAKTPILTVGAFAAQEILGDTKYKITDLAGSLHDLDIDGRGERPIVTAVHPASILRGGSGSAKQDRAGELAIWSFTYDVGKIAAFGKGQGDSVRFVDDYEQVIDDPKAAIDLLTDLYEDAIVTGLVAIDVESEYMYLSELYGKLTSIGIATVDWALSVGWESFSDEFWEIFKAICADERIEKTFHNRQFDETALARYDVYCAGTRHDTMLMHHNTFPGAAHKLQRVATQFFAIRPWKSDFKHGDGSMLEETEYNAMDTLATARLTPLLKKHLDKTDSWATYDVDNALATVAARMTVVGVPIDRRENDILAEQFLTVCDRTRAAVESKARAPELREKFIEHLAFQMARKKRQSDPPGFLDRHAVRIHELTHGMRRKDGKGYLKGKEPIEFTISNTDHVVAFIQALGHRIAKVTATGKYSGDKEVLEAFTHVEEVRTILEWRAAAYNYSHFVKIADLTSEDKSKRKGLVLDSDNRVHPSWDVHKITGRWGSKPNVQNWPKQDFKGRPNLRRQVVAPDGYLFVGADFAQLEARIIGLMSGDKFLCSVFNGAKDCDDCHEIQKTKPDKFCPDHDVHTVFARAVWTDFLQKSSDDQKKLRDLVKRAEYGGFYGGSIQTLYQSIVKEFPEITLKQVARVTQIISQRMPRVAIWHQQLMKDAIQKKEIRSAVLGRRRCFPLGHADPTIVRNHPVQSTAGDIMNLGLLALDTALWEHDLDAEVILQGHDALVLEVAEEHAEQVKSLTTACLSQEHTVNDVTMIFPAEASIAKSWDKL